MSLEARLQALARSDPERYKIEIRRVHPEWFEGEGESVVLTFARTDEIGVDNHPIHTYTVTWGMPFECFPGVQVEISRAEGVLLTEWQIDVKDSIPFWDLGETATETMTYWASGSLLARSRGATLAEAYAYMCQAYALPECAGVEESGRLIRVTFTNG